MNYLEELKQRVAEAFKDATEKKDIDNMSKINTAIERISEEQDQLMAKNKELIAAYKDAVMHPGVSKQAEKEPTDVPPVQQVPDFADFVAQELSK